MSLWMPQLVAQHQDQMLTEIGKRKMEEDNMEMDLPALKKLMHKKLNLETLGMETSGKPHLGGPVKYRSDSLSTTATGVLRT